MTTHADPAALLPAVAAALAGDWHLAHSLTQVYVDPMANWLHAVLHKMEGDVANSQYWYARAAGHRFDDFKTVTEELNAIQTALQQALPSDPISQKN